MPMGCCSACHRHVLATEVNCPFCHAPVRLCRSASDVRKLALMGTSLLAGATIIGCARFFPAPATLMYGAPPPPFVMPSPSSGPSASPTPSVPPQSPQ